MRGNLLIQGGMVIDGTGNPPVRTDIGICDGRILEVAELDEDDYLKVITVKGLYVCPGIIDIHSHSDFTLILDPRAVSSITQGVTLEVVGNLYANKLMNHFKIGMNVFLFIGIVYKLVSG